MNHKLIKDLLGSFESDKKDKKERYKDFLAHIYTTFDKQVSLCKKDNIMNKYKKMRDNTIKLIISNEKQVIRELSK
tara:strand:+ start:268 stop:495 length:228 start_codon:yes stop_codon:yes gene_type:complete